MGFVIFLIILALAYLWIWPMIRPWLIRRTLRRMAKSFGFQDFTQGGRQQPGPESEPRRHRPRKKIDPSVGEYVEFEEVSVHTTETFTESTVSYSVEEQITDVEWEDLPPEPQK